MNQIKATTTKTTFSRETTVSVSIEADVSIVWALLTHASDFPRWNSTVTSIKGEIREGSTIELKSTLDEKRTFKLKIKEFVPEKRLVWGDAMGNRVYSLERGAGGVLFSMTEKIGGPLFPLFAGMIPSFDESFEKFAADLKKEAETIQRSKK
ncbi:MAG: SRPBCC domain-containing protein [Chloroflexi bacterium]|nr:SRPBCC domain-containing protein [Chloroflexota bacterium]MDL1942799.1 SRPBCC domain-containing protein [Chloroflexi bacterium CFX2]